MYKPNNAKQLLSDCTKLLISLEDKLDVSHGYNEVLLLDDLVSRYPDINIRDNIVGDYYKDFIYDMYAQFDSVCNYKPVLPYMPYNIRSGVYSSIMGIIGEYISLAICTDNYQHAKLLQSSQDQVQGNDIEYYDNDHSITADVKISTTDWTSGAVIKCHPDWFHEKKRSTRFHIVDIYNHSHFIINRSFLHSQFEKNGRNIPLTSLMNYSGLFRKHDITHLTQPFIS